MQQYQARVTALLVEAEADLRRRLRTVDDLDGIEVAARGAADRLARRLVEELLNGADEALRHRLPRGWRLIGTRERTVVSTVGPLQLRRRLYRDQQDKARLPLDEELQLAPRIRVTPRFQEIAVELCSRVPFGSAAQLLRRVLPSCPSRVTLHRLLGQVGQQRQAHGERLRRRVFDEGQPGVGDRRVARLFIEADGKWIHLQRTPGQHDFELYLGLAHEGWATEGGQRWRLQGKHVAYRVRVRILGNLQRLARRALRPALFREMLAQALRKILRGAEWRQAYQAACRGQLLVAIRALQRSGHPDALRVIRYLRANRDGLTDYRLRPGFQDPGLRGLGAAEGNVDKVVANRFTKRGMAWTFKGAGHMAKVLEASHNGVLRDAIPRRARPARRRAPLRKFLYSHAANAAVGADAGSILHAPFVNRSADDFGRLLHRIGRPGTVWWVK